MNHRADKSHNFKTPIMSKRDDPMDIDSDSDISIDLGATNKSKGKSKAKTNDKRKTDKRKGKAKDTVSCHKFHKLSAMNDIL